jgi:hypothetical protein
MPRNLTKWALTALGVGLVLAGAIAMWRGWDQVQLERGWSLFISGAVLLAGGFVVVAAAAIVARLDRLIALAQAPLTQARGGQALGSQAPVAQAPLTQAQLAHGPLAPVAAPPPPAPAGPEFAPEEPPAPIPEATSAPEPVSAEAVASEVAAVAAQFASEIAPRFAARPRFKGAAPPPGPDEPRKVDTYRSGDLTYVMFSDGSVEVHAPTGAQRYASLAELREHMLQQN